MEINKCTYLDIEYPIFLYFTQTNSIIIITTPSLKFVQQLVNFTSLHDWIPNLRAQSRRLVCWQSISKWQTQM